MGSLCIGVWRQISPKLCPIFHDVMGGLDSFNCATMVNWSLLVSNVFAVMPQL